MPPPWFNVRKAAQIAAFFAGKEGKRIQVLKLAKLIYLADREHMENYGYPLLNDRLVSMPHGPVNSITLNYINGLEGDEGVWGQFISPLLAYSVGVVSHDLAEEDLDELNEVEIKALHTVWNKFGHMNKFQLRDWTHENCPEWEDPDGSASPIPHERVLKFLGHKNARVLSEEVNDDRQIEKIFSSFQ